MKALSSESKSRPVGWGFSSLEDRVFPPCGLVRSCREPAEAMGAESGDRDDGFFLVEALE